MLLGDFKMLIPQIEDLLPKHTHSSFSKVTTLIYLRHGWAKRRSRGRLQLPAFTSHTVDFPALHRQMVDGIQVSVSNSESQVLAFLKTGQLRSSQLADNLSGEGAGILPNSGQFGKNAT